MQSEIHDLEQKGYAIIPGAFAADLARELRDLTEYHYVQAQGRLSDRMPFLNRDQPMVFNLQAKDRRFLDLLFGLPALDDLLRHFLNDEWFRAIPADEPNYILRSYLARSSAAEMPMHVDSFVPYGGDFVFIMQAAFILEDQTVDNGCTVVVPGSHRRGGYAPQDRSETVPLEAQRGDVVLWDSRLWHGAGENTSGTSRWSLIATFQRWWLKQAFDIPGALPQEIYAELTPSQKAVLGFCSLPFATEGEGIDMKRGYDLLPERVDD